MVGHGWWDMVGKTCLMGHHAGYSWICLVGHGWWAMVNWTWLLGYGLWPMLGHDWCMVVGGHG